MSIEESYPQAHGTMSPNSAPFSSPSRRLLSAAWTKLLLRQKPKDLDFMYSEYLLNG